MNNKSAVLSMTMIVFMLALAVYVTPVRAPTQNGPTADTLYFKMYFSPTAEWTGLKAGDIDIMDWSLSKAQYNEYVAGQAPGVSLFETKDLGMFEMDINNNETVDGLPGAIDTYPGIVNPTGSPEMRQALSMLTDKVKIASEDFNGILEIMNVPLTVPVHEDYINSTVNAGFWNYNPMAAKAMLDTWFPIGATNNPYGPGSGAPFSNEPWASTKVRTQQTAKLQHTADTNHPIAIDVNGILLINGIDYKVVGAVVYFTKAGCDKINAVPEPRVVTITYSYAKGDGTFQQTTEVLTVTTADIYELIYVIRADKPDRRAAGIRHADTLRAIGIPVKKVIQPAAYAWDQVMAVFGYHLYTGGWGLGSEPDHLHDFYSAEFANPDDYNYMMHNGEGPGMLAATGRTGNAPEGRVKDIPMEAVLNTVKEAPPALTPPENSILAANARHVQSLLWGEQGTIPSIILGRYVPARHAYRTGTQGVVEAEGLGVRTWWTGMLGRQAAAPTLKWGLSYVVQDLNVITSQWLWDAEVWQFMYDSLIGTDPQKPTSYMTTGLADWWEIGEWDGGTKNTLTFHVRGADGDGISDVIKWHDGTSLTIQDINFTMVYTKQAFGWYYSSVMYLNESKTEVDNAAGTIKFYMNVKSYFVLPWIGGVPVIKKSVWEATPPEDVYGYNPLTTDANANGVIDIFEDGTGPYKFVEMVTDDHVTLTADWDSTTAGRQNSYFLTTGVDPGDGNRFVKETIHRRGDVDYDGQIFTSDLTLMTIAISSTPYNTIGSGTWQLGITPNGHKSHAYDDQYGKMNHGNWTNTAAAMGPKPAFDNTGLKWNGAAWVAYAGWTGDPYKAEDVNYDLFVNIKDLAIVGKNWKLKALSG